MADAELSEQAAELASDLALRGTDAVYAAAAVGVLHLMRCKISSNIMARTTVDIDDAVLRDLKRLQKREGKSLGQLISELVGASLGRTRAHVEAAPPLQWTTRAMRARVDLEDKEAVRAALDSA